MLKIQSEKFIHFVMENSGKRCSTIIASYKADYNLILECTYKKAHKDILKNIQDEFIKIELVSNINRKVYATYKVSTAEEAVKTIDDILISFELAEFIQDAKEEIERKQRIRETKKNEVETKEKYNVV